MRHDGGPRLSGADELHQRGHAVVRAQRTGPDDVDFGRRPRPHTNHVGLIALGQHIPLGGGDGRHVACRREIRSRQHAEGAGGGAVTAGKS